MNKWMKTVLVLAALAMPIYPAQAGGFFGKKPQVLSWQEALTNANRKVDNEGAASVLGVRVGEHVRRIGLHATLHKHMQDFFQSLRRTGSTEAAARKCQANYELIKQTALRNPLFAHYELTALVPGDFCTLSAQELTRIRRFFQGVQPLEQALAYQKVFLLTIKEGTARMWFVVNPQDKTLTFNYNDPRDLETLDELKTDWKPLLVK